MSESPEILTRKSIHPNLTPALTGLLKLYPRCHIQSRFVASQIAKGIARHDREIRLLMALQGAWNRGKTSLKKSLFRS